MGRGPSTFKEADLARALKAAMKAGVEHPRVTIRLRDGSELVVESAKPADAGDEKNPWDEVYGDDQAETRQ